MELYILRHGTTEWNIEGLLQGDHDTPLTDDGRELALETGRALKEVTFDACLTSPLSRAYETAMLVLGDRLWTGKTTLTDETLSVSDILARKAADPAGPYAFDFRIDERIKEIDFGDWEGHHSRGEFREITPEMLNRFFNISDGHFHAPNGESLNEIFARTKAFLDDCFSNEEWEDKRVLVSTHGGCLRALLHHYWNDEDFWHGSVPPNCSISVITAGHGRMVSLEADRIFYTREAVRYYPFDNR